MADFWRRYIASFSGSPNPKVVEALTGHIEQIEAKLTRIREEAASIGKEFRFDGPDRLTRSDADQVATAEWVVDRLLLALEEPGCPECGHRNGSHSISCQIGCSDCPGVDGAHDEGCWHLCPTCRRGGWIERSEGRDGSGRFRVGYACGHVSEGDGRRFAGGPRGAVVEP